MVLDEEDDWQQDEIDLAAFQELSAHQFTANDEDKEVDWEEMFGVK